MKKQTINTIAGLGFALAASFTHADTFVGSESAGGSQKNKVIASCVDAIQRYHDKDARLFLNNKASYREVNGQRVLNVQGWAWKDGDRVRVNHQCSTQAHGELALNVVFADDIQVAQQ